MNSDPVELYASSDQSILRRLVEFCEFLRSEGLDVDPSETIDAARAVSFVGLSRVDQFRESLRATLVKSSDDYTKFENLFREFWLGKTLEKNPLGRVATFSSGKNSVDRQVRSPNSNQIGRGRITKGSKILQSFATISDKAVEDQDRVLAIYSPAETTGGKNFSRLHPEDERLTLKRRLRSFARVMATRPGRRFAISDRPSDGVLDFRKTIRSSLKSGGHMVDAPRKVRKISKSRLVVLCDISGSMDVYSETILNLAYQMCNTISGAQVFGFSTRVVPLNRYLQGRSLKEAVGLVSRNVDVWSSGTRIGAAFDEMIQRYPGCLRTSSVFVIISDGWELGDLEVFRSRLRSIQRRVRGIVWLNPQADNPDYSPLAEGMKAAMPFIDIFSGLAVFSDRNKFRLVFERGFRHQ